MTRIVAISDTHYTDQVLWDLQIPEGDILIHAGDATFRGNVGEVSAFITWMEHLPHQHKVLVPGNHDFWFMHEAGWPSRAVRVLLNKFMTIGEGTSRLSLFGMSYVKELPLWAFNKTEEEIDAFLQRVSETGYLIDILVTHMPPYGILDTYHGMHKSYSSGLVSPEGELLGSKALCAFVQQVAPPLHIFGHIHDAHGTLCQNGTMFVNAAILNDDYKVGYKPIVIDLVDGVATVVE